MKELREGNQRTTWINREPYAYWKGNPSVAETRQDLMKCNVSEEHEWNARVYAQVVMMMHFEKYGIFEKIQKTLILLVTTAILIYVCFCFDLGRIGSENQRKVTSNQTWRVNAIIGRVYFLEFEYILKDFGILNHL